MSGGPAVNAFVNRNRGWVGCESCALEATFLTEVQPVTKVLAERGTHHCDNCCIDLMTEMGTSPQTPKVQRAR